MFMKLWNIDRRHTRESIQLGCRVVDARLQRTNRRQRGDISTIFGRPAIFDLTVGNLVRAV